MFFHNTDASQILEDASIIVAIHDLLIDNDIYIGRFD